MLREAYKTYLSGDVDSALMMYLYLGELGYEVAQTNAAYILEEGEFFSHQAQTQTTLLFALLLCYILSLIVNVYCSLPVHSLVKAAPPFSNLPTSPSFLEHFSLFVLL